MKKVFSMQHTSYMVSGVMLMALAPSAIVYAQTGMQAVPLAWYITRVSGILAFVMMYLSFFFGFSLRITWIRKFFPFNMLAVHRRVSVLALIFTVVHAVAPIFDRQFRLSTVEVLIPFISDYATDLIAMGVIGMYLMAILVVSSYLQKRLPYWFWRVLHYSYVVLYVLVVIHAIRLGTDFAQPWVVNLIYAATGLLVILAVLNIRQRILVFRAKRNRLMSAKG